ncbi:MAG: hypothetical protein PF795_10485 [Kiritimatiellae bacterium]|jgi:hypothetical protein|nr:hypothetical protein [Kiritimatiellia bacterium]
MSTHRCFLLLVVVACCSPMFAPQARSASALRIGRFEQVEDDIVVDFPSVVGKTYDLERSTTLLPGSWERIIEAVLGTDGIITITDPEGAADPEAFYRIAVTSRVPPEPVDYDGGKKYPSAANVRIESFDVPVNASVIHVPVTLDRQSPNTVIAYVRVFDGQGGRANPDKTKAVLFRPGDPLIKTASFDVRQMQEGNNVRAVQPSVPDGGNRASGTIYITASQGAINEPIEGGRNPFTFAPVGELCYSATGQTIQFDDQGGPNRFSTALSHGRTQVGNAETGYYGTVGMGGFERTPEGLLLSTRRLADPVVVGSPAMEYPFNALMFLTSCEGPAGVEGTATTAISSVSRSMACLSNPLPG